jgi:hypothetical protein
MFLGNEATQWINSLETNECDNWVDGPILEYHKRVLGHVQALQHILDSLLNDFILCIGLQSGL